MYVACKYNENGICRCSRDKLIIAVFEKETGWKCCGNCPFQVELYTEKDRDWYLLKCMKNILRSNFYGMGIFVSICITRIA